MKNIVGIKELRNNLDEYIEKVEKGSTFLVLKRSKPVFTISAPDKEEEMWEEVVDFTKFKRGGVNLEELLGRLEKIS